jgi:acyl carrier protein
MSDIREKVIEIVVDQLDAKPEDVDDSKSFTEDLQADSLAIVELVLALEEKFSVKIPDDEVDKIKTVGDAIKYIEEHAEKQQ